MAFQDFDLISQRRQQERKQKIKKRIILAIVSGIVIGLLAAAAVFVVLYKNNEHVNTEKNNDKNDQHHASAGKSDSKQTDSPSPDSDSSTSSKPVINTSQKAVKAVCSSTDYKKTCEDSMLKAVKDDKATQPMDIIRASFSVASDEIDQVIKKAKDMKFDTPMKKAAFNDCLVLLNDAKEELNSSVSSADGDDLERLSSVKPDINNWLSAVLSYQQTCIDGFPDGKEKDSMKKLLNTSLELGSNALAIVSQASSVLSSVFGPQRKLGSLQDTEKELDAVYPKWMNQEHRRMLKVHLSKLKPNVTVAKDGTGNFTTINAALKALPKKYSGRYVIYVKKGVYDESVVVTKKMVNITMYGEGSQKSIITGKKNFVDGVPTFQTASFAALGEGFMAQSLGFRNTAGPNKHQAVALRVQSDRSIFVSCRMEGYQDTLYAQTHRHFYRSCYITGTIDFIFGDAAAVFQNCMIYVRKPLDNQKNIVTAQGRTDKRETTGIVLQNCKILADDKLEPVKAKFKSYLGRPWKQYSRTIIMETEIGDLISPEGWLEWSGDFALKTLFYAEYNNKGGGSDTSKRVKWAGYKKIKKDEALKYTAGPFLQGEEWLKSADVPVRFGMFNE